MEKPLSPPILVRLLTGIGALAGAAQGVSAPWTELSPLGGGLAGLLLGALVGLTIGGIAYLALALIERRMTD